MTRKNAFYAQSGGVTAVINASACGVLQTAREHSGEIGKVYVGRNGIIGALTEDLIDTSVAVPKPQSQRSNTPRVPRSGPVATSLHRFTNTGRVDRLIEVFRAHDIGFFFYNGGGRSQGHRL